MPDSEEAGRTLRPTVLTFLAPSSTFPIGGVMAIYEFAGAMSRLGHEVHIVHVDFFGNQVRGLDDVGWFTFEETIRHHFPGQLDDRALPSAEFVFCFDDRVPGDRGLPLMFVQAYRILPEELETRLFREPCPKLCISTWLTSVVRSFGVPDHQLVHLPYGLRHEKYRVVVPLDERPAQVSMLYNPHPTKGAVNGLRAIGEAKETHPDLRAVVFGTMGPPDPIPPWMTFLDCPTQEELVNDAYNMSRVFVSSSLLEGFGFAPVEAMACGCALVTTANGGSDDYAIHDRTALVSKPSDVAAMARHIEVLLDSDEKRLDLSSRGRELVGQLSWDASALRLDAFLSAYAADPSRYQQAATTTDAVSAR